MEDLFNKLMLRTVGEFWQMIEARQRAFMERFWKSQVVQPFTEQEAADYLKISKETLAAYRKRKAISVSILPMAKQDKTGDTYRYELVDLMSFLQRHKSLAAGGNVYEMNVTPFGAEVRREKAA